MLFKASDYNRNLTIPCISESQVSSVAGIAGGLSAAVLVILGVLLGVFVYRRTTTLVRHFTPFCLCWRTPNHKHVY